MAYGKYYEELNIGDVYKHRPGRTVTETDNLLFTTLTHNIQSLHLDEEYAKTTPYGGRIVNSLFTLSFVVGVGVGELTEGTTQGNLGFDETTFPAPVRIGDTLRGETEVIKKRDSKSREDVGIVWFEHRGYNQRDELVVKTKRTALMMKKQ
ncbi:dehydratase [Sporosarcina sp. P26b]|uniref:MaoC family dehydratase n=1 Tax=unclassified Sporosarcina TaxID=2647733 RepID=UPI000C163AC7|nr:MULTISPECIES: MaoC family dehydratase [unclassified Sporosarcina]PIC74018.1 dehydratase [Sporosarcina sp. P17b]PIC94843.1 dehydratase [Sporosarcina sp. P26b]